MSFTLCQLQEDKKLFWYKYLLQKIDTDFLQIHQLLDFCAKVYNNLSGWAPKQNKQFVQTLTYTLHKIQEFLNDSFLQCANSLLKERPQGYQKPYLTVNRIRYVYAHSLKFMRNSLSLRNSNKFSTVARFIVPLSPPLYHIML